LDRDLSNLDIQNYYNNDHHFLEQDILLYTLNTFVKFKLIVGIVISLVIVPEPDVDSSIEIGNLPILNSY
jgi:hypothetical protein